MVAPCVFCSIVDGSVDAPVVDQTELTMAFLDHRPVFPGHVLHIPRAHHATLTDLPPELIEPFFARAQLLAGAVQRATNAEGTFVAMNNTVSQSVPHAHLHIVPRRRKDGLRGFFWPRTKYSGDEELRAVQEAIASEVKTGQTG